MIVRNTRNFRVKTNLKKKRKRLKRFNPHNLVLPRMKLLLVIVNKREVSLLKQNLIKKYHTIVLEVQIYFKILK